MKRALVRRLIVVALVALAGTAQLSCSINDYCLNCAKGDDGGTNGDGGDGDGGTNGDGGDGDGGGCIATGPEVCDGKDNDCNGLIDDGVLPEVGALCDNQKGACAGGVKVCTNGVLKCTKNPTPETCDTIDNDCNGLTDEGDPGGGSKCGTDVGECTAGANHCVNGTIQCQGFQDHTGNPELCNGLDDNCNGSFDEGLTNMGPCGIKTCVGGTKRGSICQANIDCTGGGMCLANVGQCHQGTLSCQGGAQQCGMFTTPSFEMCDMLDNDCDGLVDEDFNLATDTTNCGMCGNVCPVPPNAVATCTGATGTCGFACKAGFHDLDGMAANGCEYACFNSGVEVCDGVDNDCDGKIDGADPDLGAAPAICSNVGECAVGHTVTCNGAMGWVCNYGATVSQMNGVIIPETKCDNKDNDCNGTIDDHQLNKGAACDDGKIGQCKSSGTFTCDPMNLNGPAVCTFTTMGVASSPESCNNLDDDCDGVVDNVSAAGTFASGLEWINIGGGHQMMKYEASKPDATGADGGQVATSCGSTTTISTITEVTTTATVTTVAAHGLGVGRMVAIAGTTVAGYNTVFLVVSVPTATTYTITATSGLGSATGGTSTPQCPTCSKAGVQPWVNVTYPQALAACKAVGATLCDDVEWHRACSAVNSTTYPVGVAAAASITLEAEDYFARTAAPAADTGLHAWVEDYTLGYSSVGDMLASPDGTGGNCSTTTTQACTVGAPTATCPGAETCVAGSATAANAIARSPRLDYKLTFSTAGTYRVCVRGYSNVNSARLVWAGISPTLPDAAANLKAINNNGGNNAWQWAGVGGFNVAVGTNFLSLYMADDGLRIDQVFITSGATCPAATTVASPGNTWAYAATPNTYQPTTCNGHDYDAATDSTLTTGFLASCFADDSALTGGTMADRAFDMSGNVKEWTLAQQTGQNPVRGGASNNTDVGTSCALNFTLANDTFFFPNVGFRCCR